MTRGIWGNTMEESIYASFAGRKLLTEMTDSMRKKSRK